MVLAARLRCFWTGFIRRRLMLCVRGLAAGKTCSKVRASEHELSELLANMPVAVLIRRPDGMIRYANEAAREMFDIAAEELQGDQVLSPHWRYVREDGSSMPDHEVPAIRALVSRQPVRNCLAGAVTGAHSEPHWLQINAYPDLNTDGTVRQVVTSFLDITERRRAEEDLRERETMYRSLVAAMAEGVCFQDASGAITATNPAAEKLFAGSEEPAAGHTSAAPALPCIHEDGSPFPAETHPAMVTLRTGEPQSDVPMGFCKQDGTVTWVSVNSQPLKKDGAAKPYAAVTTFRNVTAVKQAGKDRLTHLHFFESLDHVNRAIQGAGSPEQMMSDVLDAAISIFGCDRAALVYPLDPDMAFWQAPMERNGPGYADLELETLIPHNPVMERDFRYLLEKGGPLKVGPGGDLPLVPMSSKTLKSLAFQSVISMPVYPKEGKPWVFALLQYSYARVWTPEEERLFKEVARRVADGLSTLLSHRNVRENEQKYREIFDNVSDSLLLFDVTSDGGFRYADMNPFAEKIGGAVKSAAVGRLFEEVARPEQVEQSLPLFRQCVETGEPVSYEEHIEVAAGPRDFNTVLLPVRNESGAVYRLIVFNRDVTEIKTAERQFRTLVAHLPDYITRLDADARCIYVSPAVTAAFGAPAGRFMGMTVRDMFPALSEDTKDRMIARVKQVFTDRTGSSSEIQIPMPSGLRTMEIRHIPELDRNGRVTSVLSISRDVTERIRMTDSLRQLSAAVEQSPVAVLITDIDGAIQYVNPAFCENSRYTAQEVLGENPRILQDDTMSKEDYAALWNTIKAGNSWRGAFHNRRKDGTRHWEEAFIAPIRDSKGAIIQFVGIQQDITARKKAEEKVEFLAHHDALTDLPNRLLGKDRMEMAMRHAERQGNKAALMFLDLDGFKRINDSLGHGIGDALLKAVAARLQLCIRRTDTIARQGGDEFLLILADISDPEAITSVALATLEHMATPFLVGGHELSVTASVGAAVYPDDGKDWDTLFKKADVAMYCAKEAGRNAYRFYTAQMNADADEYLSMRNKLQHALERGEFVMHYQPQVDLKTGEVTGVEALIRWNSPELGLVPPARFIPLAEDSGLIVPIGAWALKEACRQAAVWCKAGLPGMGMAVNLSAVQFKRGDVLGCVQQALAGSGFDPARLELEMTETILIKDTANVLATVRQLKAMGIKLSIDDFGTGYSSLSYLKRFNADKVKIDQSFVRDIATDANSDAIVCAIVHMAKSLGLSTIAEGVENEQVLAVLRRHGCDEVQGYYYAEPMAPAQMTTYLNTCRPADRLH